MYNVKTYIYVGIFVTAFLFFPCIDIPVLAVEQNDPGILANHILALIRVNDCDGLLEIMDNDVKNDFLPFNFDNRQKLQDLISSFIAQIGKVEKVSDLKVCTTPKGKPGVAAKIKKKDDNVLLIILSKTDNVYFFENCDLLPLKTFKEYLPFKKNQ